MLVTMMRCALCVLIVLSSSCALSPQIAHLDPKITVADNAPIINTTASIHVIDQRGSTTVGSRGGVYASTSQILTAPDLPAVMQKRIERAFRELGIRITQDQPAYTIQVALQNLSYRVEKTTLYTVTLSATLQATITHLGAQYTGTYHGQTTNQSLLALSEKDNTALLTQTLNTALNQILSDKKLTEFLQSQ